MLIRDEGYGYKPASVVLPRISANSFWDQQPTIETQRDMPQEWFSRFSQEVWTVVFQQTETWESAQKGASPNDNIRYIPGPPGPPGPPGEKGNHYEKLSDFLKFQKSRLFSVFWMLLLGERGVGRPGMPGLNGTPGVKGDRGDRGANGLNGLKGAKGEPSTSGAFEMVSFALIAFKNRRKFQNWQFSHLTPGRVLGYHIWYLKVCFSFRGPLCCTFHHFWHGANLPPKCLDHIYFDKEY